MEMMKMTPPTDGFYTMKGYTLMSAGELTSAMEDYLEMIARMRQNGSRVRVVDISSRLHVKASSVTKMIQQLSKAGLVNARKYGDIELTQKGDAHGEYLLYRHDVIHRFLCMLNESDNELEQVEKIEHFIDEKTVRNLYLLCEKLGKC